MIIVYLVVSLVSVSSGLRLKIGGVFDTNYNDLQQSIRCGVEVANKEILVDSSIRLDSKTIETAYGNEFAASKNLCQLLQVGSSAVFGPNSPSSSSHCMSICDAKEIPYIDVNFDDNTKPPVINLHPHPDAIADIFVALIKDFQWKGFTVIYESAPWLPRVAKLLKLYDSQEYTVTVRRINVGLYKTNYRPVLRRVKMSGEQNIVLDCSIETLPELLRQVQQVGLMTDSHKFIITTMDMHTIDLEPYQYSDTTILGIRLVDPDNPLMEQMTKCMAKAKSERDAEGETAHEEDSEGNNANEDTAVALSVQSALIFDGVLLLAEAFKQFDVNRLQSKSLNCDDMDAWEDGNSITNFMRNTVVQGLTGDIMFDNRGLRTNFAVDVISLTSSGIAKVAVWNATTGLNSTAEDPSEQIIPIDDESSLKNKTLRVITVINPPYGMLKDSTLKLTGNDRFEGYGIDLIHELSLILGFNYEFELQADGVYGVPDNVTGEWSGMVKKLIDKEADLAITDLTITSQRESAVDFTMPFMNLGISVVIKRPEKESPSTFSFMSPFSTEVWLYLGLAYVGVSLCLFILGRISPAEWDNPYPCIEEPDALENQFSFSNALWFATGALLQQGSEIAPKAASTRAVASIWWFFTLIMVSSYTANLAAFLTVEVLTPPIKGVEDLEKCHLPDYECPVDFGAKKSGSTIDFFKEADSGLYRNMYTYMSTHPDSLTDSNEEGLKRAEEPNYAYLMESSSIEYFTERNCKVTQLGGLLDDKGYGIAMRKNSTYRSALSEAVLRLQEQGKLTAMKTRWWKEKTKGTVCSAKGSGGDAEALDLANMKGVFYVLAGGSAFASLYGICEWLLIIYFRAKRENLPYKEELMDEMKFVVECSGNTKPVRHRKSSSIHSNGSAGSNSS